MTTAAHPRLEAIWCFLWDWTEWVGDLYASDAPPVRRFVGAAGQQLWFKAHSGRIYAWILDGRWT